MRVLMLSWDFPPQAVGGTAAHVVGLSQALSDADHDVRILTIADRRMTGPEPIDGVEVHRAAISDLPWLPPTAPIAQAAGVNHAVVKLAIARESPLAGWEPDVVHGHDWRIGWAADTLAAHFGAPFVLTMHGTERVRHGGNLPMGSPTDVNSIEWWLAFRADRLIASTRFMVEQLVTGFELPPEHVARVPNGIDPELWDRPGDDPPVRELLVVSWGRVQYEKGFQVLARAMQTVRGRIPNVRAVIAGRGSYLPELQTQIDVEGVSEIIDLPGFLSDDALRQLLGRAGCAVIPSLYEPFGVVALEALAAGAPLIVAHTGGLAEMVDGTDAALTFEPGNADDLALAIERVLTDPMLATTLTAHARELVDRKYAWDAIADATARVYDTARVHRGFPRT